MFRRYRSGYSHKDPNQSHILALKIPHQHFLELLSQAVVGESGGLTAEERGKGVRVQWDPERNPRLGQLDYRSIQIGISGRVAGRWAEGVVGIEDVTGRARELKSVVDGDGDLDLAELIQRGLVPEERVYEVSDELRGILKMHMEK